MAQQPVAPGDTADQPPELQQVLVEVKQRQELASKTHRAYKDRWDKYYGLYRNFRRLKTAVSSASERDRDMVLDDARREWGAELFIPYCFTTVETIVPRVLSQDPKMIVLPRSEQAQTPAQNVQDLINGQQKDISYDLKLQSVARSGLKYGLGVQKTYWENTTRKVLRQVPRRVMPGLQTVSRQITIFDGPQVEPVDIRDFFWDPAGDCIANCEWVIHRTWRSQQYVARKVEQGEWFPVDLERVQGYASNSRQALDAPRLEAAGVPGSADQSNKGKLHEIWEYHDRDRVVVVLDKKLVVANDVSPFFHRDLPFQIFRPTPQEHEFVGIGEIEPIAHLQYEINTLRSQRRDNATLVLQKAFLYADGFVDPDDLIIKPGGGIPIKGTDLRSVIQPLEFPDIPQSSYRESEEIQQDFERTTGVNDALAGGGAAQGSSGADTATGIQLVQQAANVRIRLKTKNLESETIREAGRQFLELNRQHILQEKPIRVSDPTQEAGFRFTSVTPQDLASDLEGPIPDAGSTEPENPALKQQAAITLYQALQTNQAVDQQRLAAHMLREYGVQDAEAYLIPQGTALIDMQVLEQQLGMVKGIPPEAQQEILLALQAALAAGQGEQPAEPVSAQAPPQEGGDTTQPSPSPSSSGKK